MGAYLDHSLVGDDLSDGGYNRTIAGRSVYLCSLANTEADRSEYEYPHRAIIDRDYCVITHLNEKE